MRKPITEREARALAREFLGRNAQALSRAGSQARGRRQSKFLRDWISRSIEAGIDFSKVPIEARTSIARTVRGDGVAKPGPKPADLATRDKYICLCINHLCRAGLQPRDG